MQVKLKDGKTLEVAEGQKLIEVARAVGPQLAKKAVVAKVNGVLMGLYRPLHEPADVEFLTFEEAEARKVYWHSASHILAQAVKRLYPKAQLAIGPAIDEGFYYDFDVPETFSPEDLGKIEAEMQKIIAADYDIQRLEFTKEEALKMVQALGENYKSELISEMSAEETVSFYQQGEFIDLCSGPHLPSTGKIRAFKLLNTAGAYWRGDEKNKMLQRIYGTAYPKKTMLQEYLHRLEEAKKRDHRKLGLELDLFSFKEVGPGFPFFHPKGVLLRNNLEDFWRAEHDRMGYQEIKTPMLLRQELWEQSGHWDHYKENMYFTTIDDDNYAIKPMNCPGGILIYKSKLHSYRELPIRMGELGVVHRHELSGVLHGLMRARSFTQDDAHIFCRPEQAQEEISNIIELTEYFYGEIFGFDYHVELSTRPEKAMGSDKIWEMATIALTAALEQKELKYRINEGDGAFYGPKIDFHLRDCLGRTWQCGTIQVDFLMPEKFDLEYVGEDGEKHRPVVIHRVIYGSLERFMAILTEHFAGAFPLWLSPVQVRILPITDRQKEYGQEVCTRLKAAGIRAEFDSRNEKVGYKIREAQVQKVPYMVIVGDKEVDNNSLSVRHRSEGDMGSMEIGQFEERVRQEVVNKIR